MGYSIHERNFISLNSKLSYIWGLFNTYGEFILNEAESIIYTRVIQYIRGIYIEWGGTYHIYKGHSIYKGDFIWLRRNLSYIQGSFNTLGKFILTEEEAIIYTRVIQYIRGIYFDWGGSYHIYEGHSIHKGNLILTEEKTIIYTRVIQYIREIYFDWGGSYHIYMSHSIHMWNLFWLRRKLSYIQWSFNMKGEFYLTEEEPITYTGVIQYIRGIYFDQRGTNHLYKYHLLNNENLFLKKLNEFLK